MIDALIAGRLQEKPVQRTSKHGRAFATATVRVAMRDDACFVGLLAFKPDLVRALLALDAGDSVAISGALQIGIYTNKQGAARPSVELLAETIATSYAVSRKRAAQQPAEADAGDVTDGAQPQRGSAPTGKDIDGDIPF